MLSNFRFMEYNREKTRKSCMKALERTLSAESFSLESPYGCDADGATDYLTR